MLDALLLATQLTVTAVDWRQTRYIADHPEQFAEQNPTVSRHPSAGQVNRYFLIYEAATIGAAYAFPVYRSQILGASIAVEVMATARNRSIGIRCSF